MISPSTCVRWHQFSGNSEREKISSHVWTMALRKMVLVAVAISEATRLSAEASNRFFLVPRGRGLNQDYWIPQNYEVSDAERGYREAFEEEDNRIQDNIVGGVDFSQALPDPETGQLCVTREEEEDTKTRTSHRRRRKDPILDCRVSQARHCHTTYVTRFTPVQEEVCEEVFEKTCQIVFGKSAVNETIRRCHRPLEKECDQENEEEDEDDLCKTLHETICTTKYNRKDGGGGILSDTSCDKIPVELCGRPGCRVVEGQEKCYEDTIVVLVDVPEETCDISPRKVCGKRTRLVPSLSPEEECTVQPKHVCQMRFENSKEEDRKVKVKYCLPEKDKVEEERKGKEVDFVEEEEIEVEKEPDFEDEIGDEIDFSPIDNFIDTQLVEEQMENGPSEKFVSSSEALPFVNHRSALVQTYAPDINNPGSPTPPSPTTTTTPSDTVQMGYMIPMFFEEEESSLPLYNSRAKDVGKRSHNNNLFVPAATRKDNSVPTASPVYYKPIDLPSIPIN